MFSRHPASQPPTLTPTPAAHLLVWEPEVLLLGPPGFALVLANWVATTRPAKPAPDLPHEHRWGCAVPLTNCEPVRIVRQDVSADPTTGEPLGLVAT